MGTQFSRPNAKSRGDASHLSAQVSGSGTRSAESGLSRRVAREQPTFDHGVRLGRIEGTIDRDPAPRPGSMRVRAQLQVENILGSLTDTEGKMRRTAFETLTGRSASAMGSAVDGPRADLRADHFRAAPCGGSSAASLRPRSPGPSSATQTCSLSPQPYAILESINTTRQAPPVSIRE